MQARIYQPAKTAMQSGRAKTRVWVLEYEPQAPRTIDALMGWTSSPDTQQQVQINFDSQEDAVAFCQKNGLEYVILPPRERKFRVRPYAENFRWDKVA